MSDRDVAAELRHWADQGTCPPLQLIRGAINEIMALRQERIEFGHAFDRKNALIIAAYNEALDEAAGLCCEPCAIAIRAMKDTP